MFRIIVISLFVLNVLLAGFQASQRPVQKKVATRVIEEEDSNIPTIYLFSELLQDQDLMSGNRQCFTLGPFHDIVDMNEVRSRLQEVSLSINDRQTQALVEKGYWVFLGPYPSLLEANDALLALYALGLKDIRVLYEGERRNAISLGYYLRQENALKRKQVLEAKGYEALVRVQRRAEPRYWLDYEQNPGSGLIDLDMQNRPNDFMQRALPCPEQSQLEANAAEPEALEPELLESKSPEPEPLKSELPKSELPKSESSESEPPKSEPPESTLLKSDLVEPELLGSEPLESEPLESEPLELELPKSDPPESALLKSGLVESEPLEPERPKSEPSKLEPPKSESLESELPKLGLTESEPLESELPKLELRESEPLESEQPESGMLNLGPPVLDPWESESPVDSETPVQTDTLEERDGPESADG